MSAEPLRNRQFSWRDPARTAAAAARMAGLDYLQGVVRGDYRTPMHETREREVTAVEPGRAEYRLRPREFHFNPAGTLINAGHRSGAAAARVRDAKGRLCACASTACMVFRPERGR